MTDRSHDFERLTSAAGIPLATDDTSKTAGPRGPLLMEDYALFQKMAHFNRERIPERVVHAVGAGAYGTFTVTKNIARWTKAAIFSQVGKVTELFVRFSTVAKSKGGPDINRDVRGFAVKFYTEEGNWDLVGNNTPVFFVRDPYKFMDFIRSQKEHPRRHWRQDAMWWDFWSRRPESLHQVLILMSDRGIPKGFRHMNGYGSHTFSLINAENERVWVKFHLKTQQGIDYVPQAESDHLCGIEPSYSTKDLYAAIATGDYPRWTLYVQIMSEEEARAFPFNPFDLTKVWPHGDFPLHEVGVVELNRNPQNYFADVEQAAFSPGNVVPGISWSPDKMLQARIVSYADAHRYRLGVNHEALPVNRPKVRVNSYDRDGAMRFDGNDGGRVNYAPSREDHPMADPTVEPPPLPLDGTAGRHAQTADDHYEQPRALYRLMPEDEKRRLVTNIIGTLGQAPDDVIERQLELFRKVDPDLRNRISTGMQEMAHVAE